MTTRKRGGIRPEQQEQQRKIMMQGRYEEEKGEGKEILLQCSQGSPPAKKGEGN